MTSRTDSGENLLIFQNNHLIYTGHQCQVLPIELVSYGDKVKSLDLSFNSLRSLDRMKEFPNLEELILDNNYLSDNLEFSDMNNLHTLMLNKNQITDLDHLLTQISQHLPKLRYLSLLGNIACPNQLSSKDKDDDDYRRYRLYVLYKLPNLKFLDSTPIKEAELKEAKRQGEFLKVVKPTISDDPVTKKESKDMPSPYKPLPDEIREEGDRKATFGKCRYMYYGKHSEGNRFIRNKDL